MGLRELKLLSGPIVFAVVLATSWPTFAAPSSIEPCRSDYAKLAEVAKARSAAEVEQHRRALEWILQNLFEHQDPGADVIHRAVRVGRHGEPTINGAMITGAQDYRLFDVKKHLSLTEDYMHKFPTNAEVLSVGEGISELAENLRIKFPNTKALDLWYEDPNLPKELSDFVRANRPYLIAGSATNMPIASRSKDLVVSHMLLNNLDSASQMKALGEMIRVLKVGGEAKIAFASEPNRDVLSLLRRVYGDEIEVTGARWESNWRTQMMDHAGQTLTIRRLR